MRSAALGKAVSHRTKVRGLVTTASMRYIMRNKAALSLFSNLNFLSSSSRKTSFYCFSEALVTSKIVVILKPFKRANLECILIRQPRAASLFEAFVCGMHWGVRCVIYVILIVQLRSQPESILRAALARAYVLHRAQSISIIQGSPDDGYKFVDVKRSLVSYWKQRSAKTIVDGKPRPFSNRQTGMLITLHVTAVHGTQTVESITIKAYIRIRGCLSPEIVELTFER